MEQEYIETEINIESPDFTAGFALALAEMIRNGAHLRAAEATLNSSGYTDIEDFRGVAEFDWDTLVEYQEELWPENYE